MYIADLHQGLRFKPHPLATAIALSATVLPFPLLAMNADQLAELGIFCTTNPAVTEHLESGSALYTFYFDSQDTGVANDPLLKRSCLDYGYSYLPSFWNIHFGIGGFSSTILQSNLRFLPAALVEGDTDTGKSLSITLTRGGNIYSNASLDYSITGSASLGTDYLFGKDGDVSTPSGTLVFPAWDADPRTIKIDILDDQHEEEDEILEISFSNMQSDQDDGVLFSQPNTSVVILDDDKIATSYSTAYSCMDFSEPYDIFQDGSGIFYVEQGSSVTQIVFLGNADSTQMDWGCVKEGWINPSFVPSPNININSSNAPGNGNNISINGYTPPESLPEITHIDSHDSSVAIHFNAEANPIGYTASCVSLDSGHTVSGHATQSPITLNGMINGENYLCSVAHFDAASGSPGMTASPSPAAGEAAPITTLSQWAMAILSSLLMMSGFLWGRKREDG